MNDKLADAIELVRIGAVLQAIAPTTVLAECDRTS